MSNQAVKSKPTECMETAISQLDQLASAINAAKSGLRKQRSEQQLDETLKTYQQKAGTIEQTTQFLQSIGSRT